ncbi:MAG: gliding motility-associated C-terminal domain-containing protein [Elusimicrobia bacterium]|nr:gliding motility-associated C-terminal domain-containing protein [Elusimicrobiota bacterium]
MKTKLFQWLSVVVGILGVPRWLFAPPLDFQFDPAAGLSGKIITPNGDSANDAVFFRYSNPFDSGVELQIFDITGALVRTLAGSSGTNQIVWDGRDVSGSVVASGIYIYQIRSEEKVFNGTILVAR